MNKCAKILIGSLLFAASTATIAQTGACQESPGSDKCWCDSGQPIGSCFSRLSERGTVPFPTTWGISQPGPYQGWSIYVDNAANTVSMYYQGQLQGTQAVPVINGDKYRFQNDVQGDYLLTGASMFDAFGIRFQLSWEANQIGYKTGHYNITKNICINGLCYTSN